MCGLTFRVVELTPEKCHLNQYSQPNPNTKSPIRLCKIKEIVVAIPPTNVLNSFKPCHLNPAKRYPLSQKPDTGFP
jgi:hypothetical protein